MNRIVSIILTIALGIVIITMPFASYASYDPEYIVPDVSVQVFQQNTNYAGWSNNSGVMDAPINLGILSKPQSLAILSSSASVLSGETLRPNNVEVSVSYPTTGASQVIYFAVCNTFSAFNTSVQLETYFNWNDSFKGYVNKTGFTSSMGYYAPISATLSDYSVVSGSNRICNYEIRVGGTTSTTVSWTGTATCTGVGSANMYTPQLVVGGGSVYDDFAWLNSGNNLYIYRLDVNREVDATNNPWTSVSFKLPSTSLNSCKVISNASSSRYIHSAVFVPLCVVYDSTNFDEAYISKLDSIINTISSIDSGIESLGISLEQIIDILGTGDITVLDALEDIISRLSSINQSLAHLNIVGGGPTGSAVQYIEYYMRNVSANTNTMITQLNDIVATLNQISTIIDDANNKAESISEDSEDIHEQEQQIFEDANDAIGSTVISSFAFDADTSAGMARVGIDFTNLWNSLGTWHNVYIFSMTLTLAFTIIRFSSARARAKEQAEYRQAQKEYYESRKNKGG